MFIQYKSENRYLAMSCHKRSHSNFVRDVPHAEVRRLIFAFALPVPRSGLRSSGVKRLVVAASLGRLSCWGRRPMPIASASWMQDRQGRDPLSPHLEIRIAQIFEWPLRVPKPDIRRCLARSAKPRSLVFDCSVPNVPQCLSSDGIWMVEGSYCHSGNLRKKRRQYGCRHPYVRV